MSVDVAENKDSYMDFTIFHTGKHSLIINDLSETEMTRKVGGPQICR